MYAARTRSILSHKIVSFLLTFFLAKNHFSTFKKQCGDGFKIFGYFLDENGDFLSADRLHITIGKWKTADENWVHGIGVTPDVLVDRSDTEKAFKTFIGDETIMYDVVDMRVANIQLILNTMGYSVRTDGYFDVVTKDAILDIQNENGLTETGNIDSDTLVVINNALGDYLNDDANDSMLQASIDYFSE